VEGCNVDNDGWLYVALDSEAPDDLNEDETIVGRGKHEHTKQVGRSKIKSPEALATQTCRGEAV
jgi:hypothetical protein